VLLEDDIGFIDVVLFVVERVLLEPVGIVEDEGGARGK